MWIATGRSGFDTVVVNTTMTQLREKSSTTFTKVGIPKKLVRLIKMCLSKNYSKVFAGQFLFDAFPICCGLNQVDALSPLFFNHALRYVIRRFQENRLGLELYGKH